MSSTDSLPHAASHSTHWTTLTRNRDSAEKAKAVRALQASTDAALLLEALLDQKQLSNPHPSVLTALADLLSNVSTAEVSLTGFLRVLERAVRSHPGSSGEASSSSEAWTASVLALTQRLQLRRSHASLEDAEAVLELATSLSTALKNTEILRPALDYLVRALEDPLTKRKKAFSCVVERVLPVLAGLDVASDASKQMLEFAFAKIFPSLFQHEDVVNGFGMLWRGRRGGAKATGGRRREYQCYQGELFRKCAALAARHADDAVSSCGLQVVGLLYTACCNAVDALNLHGGEKKLSFCPKNVFLTEMMAELEAVCDEEDKSSSRTTPEHVLSCMTDLWEIALNFNGYTPEQGVVVVQNDAEATGIKQGKTGENAEKKTVPEEGQNGAPTTPLLQRWCDRFLWRDDVLELVKNGKPASIHWYRAVGIALKLDPKSVLLKQLWPVFFATRTPNEDQSLVEGVAPLARPVRASRLAFWKLLLDTYVSLSDLAALLTSASLFLLTESESDGTLESFGEQYVIVAADLVSDAVARVPAAQIESFLSRLFAFFGKGLKKNERPENCAWLLEGVFSAAVSVAEQNARPCEKLVAKQLSEVAKQLGTSSTTEKTEKSSKKSKDKPIRVGRAFLGSPKALVGLCSLYRACAAWLPVKSDGDELVKRVLLGVVKNAVADEEKETTQKASRRQALEGRAAAEVLLSSIAQDRQESSGTAKEDAGGPRTLSSSDMASSAENLPSWAERRYSELRRSLAAAGTPDKEEDHAKATKLRILNTVREALAASPESGAVLLGHDCGRAIAKEVVRSMAKDKNVKALLTFDEDLIALLRSKDLERLAESPAGGGGLDAVRLLLRMPRTDAVEEGLAERIIRTLGVSEKYFQDLVSPSSRGGGTSVKGTSAGRVLGGAIYETEGPRSREELFALLEQQTIAGDLVGVARRLVGSTNKTLHLTANKTFLQSPVQLGSEETVQGWRLLLALIKKAPEKFFQHYTSVVVDPAIFDTASHPDLHEVLTVAAPFLLEAAANEGVLQVGFENAERDVKPPSSSEPPSKKRKKDKKAPEESSLPDKKAASSAEEPSRSAVQDRLLELYRTLCDAKPSLALLRGLLPYRRDSLSSIVAQLEQRSAALAEIPIDFENLDAFYLQPAVMECGDLWTDLIAHAGEAFTEVVSPSSAPVAPRTTPLSLLQLAIAFKMARRIPYQATINAIQERLFPLLRTSLPAAQQDDLSDHAVLALLAVLPHTNRSRELAMDATALALTVAQRHRDFAVPVLHALFLQLPQQRKSGAGMKVFAKLLPAWADSTLLPVTVEALNALLYHATVQKDAAEFETIVRGLTRLLALFAKGGPKLGADAYQRTVQKNASCALGGFLVTKYLLLANRFEPALATVNKYIDERFVLPSSTSEEQGPNAAETSRAAATLRAKEEFRRREEQGWLAGRAALRTAYFPVLDVMDQEAKQAVYAALPEYLRGAFRDLQAEFGKKYRYRGQA